MDAIADFLHTTRVSTIHEPVFSSTDTSVQDMQKYLSSGQQSSPSCALWCTQSALCLSSHHLHTWQSSREQIAGKLHWQFSGPRHAAGQMQTCMQQLHLRMTESCEPLTQFAEQHRCIEATGCTPTCPQVLQHSLQGKLCPQGNRLDVIHCGIIN